MRKTPYWWAVIERAKVRKREGKVPFTDAQISKAKGWTTCACGRQDRRIPRSADGMPQDLPLRFLGIEFSREVHDGNPDDAARVLRQIEARAAVVLRGVK